MREFRWWLAYYLKRLSWWVEPRPDPISGDSLAELIRQHINANPEKTVEEMRKHNALFRRLTE